MWQKILLIPMRAYLSFVGFVDDLKNDERGISELVVIVILILVAVLAIILFWDLLKVWLLELWGRITGEVETIQ